MSVHVYIPTPFRRATNNKDRVSLDAADVKALLDALEERFGGLKGLVRDERGDVYRHVNIYVNNEPIDPREGLGTALRDGDEVSIIPALAGGSSDHGASPRDIACAPGASAIEMPVSIGR